MATEVIMRRDGIRLAAIDAAGSEAILKLPIGKQFVVTIKQARNPRQFRLYWGLIGLIFSQQSRYATQEQLSNVIKCAVGWCDEVPLKDGRVMVTPRSIAFANMAQDQFEEFFTKVIKLVITKILPGVTEADLRRELEQMVGVAA